MNHNAQHVLCLSPSGFHNMHYITWNGGTSSRVVCVHGLSRNARDFDYLSEELATNGHYVICPDLIGRGESDWVPPHLYTYPQYCADLNALLAAQRATDIHWVGTSMGGLLGMFLASQPRSPIRSLVINDIGAHIPGEALKRIGTYVQNPPVFSSFSKASLYLKKILATFGELSSEQWSHLATHSTKIEDNGQVVFKYDPQIAAHIQSIDVNLWDIWDKITCPVLLIRGQHSDILPTSTVEQMKERMPSLEVIEIAHTGHAPALMSPEQTGLIRDWLR